MSEAADAIYYTVVSFQIFNYERNVNVISNDFK